MPMKKIVVPCVVAAILLAASGSLDAGRFPVLKGPYLGQVPPGGKPEVFAPGLVSAGLYPRDIAISKDGNEIYFSAYDGGMAAIFETKLVGGNWSEPAIASFSGRGFLDMEPSFSFDGRHLFFLSNRPPAGREPEAGWRYQHIWVTARTATGWSEPRLVDAPVNTEANEFYPSVTNDNALYFTRSGKDGAARLYRAAFENGRYAEPVILPFELPEKGLLFNAFVAPGEDYLVTCALNIDSENTDQDYYISFRTRAGGWGPLIRLGPEINVAGENANSAFVSPDGKYFFFNSSRKNASVIYWMDAGFIGRLRATQKN